MNKLHILLMAVAALVLTAACDKDDSPKGVKGGDYGNYSALIFGEWRCDDSELIFDATEEIEQMFIDKIGMAPEEISGFGAGETVEFREDGTGTDGSDEFQYTLSGQTLSITYPASEETEELVINFDVQTLNETTLVVYMDAKPMLTEMMREISDVYGFPWEMIQYYLNGIRTCAVRMTLTRIQ